MQNLRYVGKNLFIEKLSIKNILKKQKTPFYIYSENQIITNFLKFKNTFKKTNPLICFAAKSNSNLNILRVLGRLGAGADSGSSAAKGSITFHTSASGYGGTLSENVRITTAGHSYYTQSVGIQTNNIDGANISNPVGAGHSLVGLYIGDGSLMFSSALSRSGGYYISTDINALNAGPVTLNSEMKLDGTWVIV